ncbi:uncharacterized protein EI90DRAFT_3059896 [Cantharellus anzutake]|uniref:uncharacterized protein n=1 Tax=Cantharellus anzutake TaxID=1750568 RepID=UPI001904125B|nr:uncharacterized protein EI90DRAFT_3068667 [Cantharellus anzutake]XP_038915547.1 uncharacterized protein EI90DRAFT_3059896 [Cantharellus anzutake]KAF8326964.1 hypothetical protein EI90DRAFT_3068667 [Cantharellus anzutake]KAF8330550.1 hypothetical protein EI90DRAFT_3059896 [Cantharellus anzutake]
MPSELTPVPPGLLVTFNQTADSCTQSLNVLKNTSYTIELHSHAHAQWPTLQSILTDYTSILSLIYTHSTNLSLAMKPPSTYPAVPRLLSDLTSDITKLTSCVQFLSSWYGATLYNEASWKARETIDTVRALVQTFIPSHSFSPHDNVPFTDHAPHDFSKTYLIRTNAIHASIESTKKGLSKSNAQAVLKVWDTHSDSIQDALEECEELTREPPPDDEVNEESEDSEDDGWDEIMGGKTGRRLTPEERDRAKKTRMLVKLTLSLHRRLSQYTLPSYSLPTSAEATHTLDTFLSHSTTLTSTIDDLVSSLHPQPPTPDQEKSIDTDSDGSQIDTPPIQEFTTTLSALKCLVLPETTTIEGATKKLADGLNLQQQQRSSTSALTSTAIRTSSDNNTRWFTLCFAQIEKTAQSLR